MKPSPLLLFIVLLSATSWACAKDIYVSPSGNDQNAGTSAGAPLATIAAASKLAVAGDNVNLLAGTYNESLVPVNSGTAAAPITYKSSGGPAVIMNVRVGILIGSLSYIVIDGINVNGGAQPPNAKVNSFVTIQNSNHIIVRHGNFKYANGWAGIDIVGRYGPGQQYYGAVQNYLTGLTSYITIEDNTIDNVGDYSKPSGDVIQVALGPVQHVLIQRNTILHGGHDLVEFDSDYGVLQDNTLNNSYSDVVSGDTGYRNVELQGSYNVIQRNYMAHARRGGGGYVAPVASIRGNENIVRQNVFFDSIAAGTATWCGPLAPDVENIRVYNNTIYQMGGDGWSAWAYATCSTAGSFVFANNLVAESRMSPGTLSGVLHGGALIDADIVFAVSGGTGLIDVGRGLTAGTVVKGNLFAPHGGGPAYVMLLGGDGRVPLSTAAAKYPQFFTGNIEQSPNFIGAQFKTVADFQLRPNSPGLASGVALTTATSSGTSDHLPVQDSLYFTDGNGLVPGDTIQLAGTNQRAGILSIDRANNVLILTQAVTFKAGQGISLPYNGAAPDIGAGVSGVRPLPPVNVTISK